MKRTSFPRVRALHQATTPSCPPMEAGASAAVPKGMRFMFTEEELKQLDSLPGEDEEEEEARTESRKIQESA